MSVIYCWNNECILFDNSSPNNCKAERTSVRDCLLFVGTKDVQEIPKKTKTTTNDSFNQVLEIDSGIQTAPKNNVQENKQMPTLIPMDILLRYLEPAYQEGLIKYYRESWRLGFPVSVMIDAALRHITEFFYEKQDFDPDAAKLGIVKHHLAGAIFSLLCVLQTLEKHPHLDDRFFLNTKPIDEDTQNANQNK